ncbi:MAG TPA: histidinol-phosphate transaminase [Bdellovibrionota bacterium]|jgi:histidinol-phosphate aminotransferase
MTVVAPKPFLPPVDPSIDKCAIYQPGKPIEELERETGIHDIIKLASNENPLGPSPKAVAAIQKALPNAHLYPDATHHDLRVKLAGHLGVEQDEVYIGSGSEEVFCTLVRSYCRPGDNTVGCGAAFLAYRVQTQVHGAEYREPPLSRDPEKELEGMLSLVDGKTRIVFLPNPNNPTGTYLDRTRLQKMLEKLKGRNIIVLLDYAYREYARAADLPGAMEFYKTYPNLIVTGTFSKIYGLAGLRVGYATAHPDLLLPMRKVKTPFNLTSLGLTAAMAALDDQEHVKRSIEVNSEGMAYLEKEFDRLGLDRWPSQGNFLLVNMHAEGWPIYQELLKRGVIVRPVGGYGLKECLRFSVGTMPENKRMIAALEQVLKGMK